MAAAGRKQAVVAVVALVAMLLVAGATAQVCGVPGGTMGACLSYCSNGGSKDACCRPMKSADVGCLCGYWNKYKNSVPNLASCAAKIRSGCGIRKSC
jgi:hypothetical protein